MIQSAARVWPADAVHDTVAAVMRTAPFQRSLQTTLLERLMSYLRQGLDWLSAYFGGLPGGRTVVIWLVSILAVLIVARVLIAARARDPNALAESARRGGRPGEDPWRTAERLAAEGDHEGAAHALYRAVLASISEQERVRLDPSRTSGDYARELRARGSGAYHPFRAFARRFDAAVYGRASIDADLVAELARLARPLHHGARAA